MFIEVLSYFFVFLVYMILDFIFIIICIIRVCFGDFLHSVFNIGLYFVIFYLIIWVFIF